MRVLLILLPLIVAVWGQTGYTILSYLQARRYTQFLQYAEQTGLTATLNGTGNVTVFAPYNSAFYRLDRSLLNDTAKLTDILKYHVVNGFYTTADLRYNELQLPSLQGANIRINYYLSSGRTTVEGQRIYSQERIVSNGVVHLLYGLMIPPVGTVLDFVSSDGNLTKLRTAIQTAGLDNFFQDQTPITLFAPTDTAFSDLGENTVQALLNNPTLLASVLKYHVIPGTLYAAGYHSDYMHTFEEADRLRLGGYLSSFEAEGSHIDRTELSATNGVVHRIDRVLIPNSLSDQGMGLAAVHIAWMYVEHRFFGSVYTVNPLMKALAVGSKTTTESSEEQFETIPFEEFVAWGGWWGHHIFGVGGEVCLRCQGWNVFESGYFNPLDG